MKNRLVKTAEEAKRERDRVLYRIFDKAKKNGNRYVFIYYNTVWKKNKKTTSVEVLYNAYKELPENYEEEIARGCEIYDLEKITAEVMAKMKKKLWW